MRCLPSSCRHPPRGLSAPKPPVPRLRRCSMWWEAGAGAATLREALVCPPSTSLGCSQAQGAPLAWGQEPAVGRRASGTSNVGVTGAGEGGGEGGLRAGPPRMRPPGHQNVTGTGGKGGASRPTSTCLSLAKRHCVKLPGRRPHARPPSPGPPHGNHLHRVPAPAPPKSQQSVTDVALPPSPRGGPGVAYGQKQMRPRPSAEDQRLLHSGCAHRPWAGLAQNRSTERFVLNLESTYGSFIESPGCPCFPSGNGGPRYEHLSSGGAGGAGRCPGQAARRPQPRRGCARPL